MKEEIAKSLKSSETEDWLDYHIVRPHSYRWAKFFNKLDFSPNTVTIMSMVIGAASCIFFASGSYHYSGWHGLLFNIIAIILLVWADVYDCADGQLARISGKKSKLGRILDGLAGFAWYIPIYAALVYRFYMHHDIEFGWLGIADTGNNALIATGIVLLVALVSGICLANQQRLADYYIQIHLFFLKGEKGSELDNSVQQKEIYANMGAETPWWERLFQKNYISYTQLQERTTPHFQNMIATLRKKYGSLDNIPTEVRNDIHDNSLKIMKINGLLTFNFRSSYLFLFCLLDVPVLAFVFEIVCMTLLQYHVNHKHEKFCKRITETIE